MNKRIGNLAAAGLALVLGLGCNAGSAQDLGKLGGLLGGGGSMSSGSMSNVAGLLQYCVKNNYLGGSSGATGIKDQLLGKLGAGGGASASGDASPGGSDVLGSLMGGKKKKAASHASGGDPTRDPGYLSGASGILQGSNGKSLDLSSVGGGSSDLKSQITTKVCDTVLKQGKGFLGM
jgi:hypothetical protein